MPYPAARNNTRFMFWPIFSLTLLLVVATLLPVWRYEAWWVRGFDFPRLQFSMLAAAILLLGLIGLELSQLTHQLVMIAATICLGYQGWWILPYSIFSPVEVRKSGEGYDAGNSIRILTANVLTPNRNAGALLALVRENKPHILVTLESDEWWQQQLQVLESEYPLSVKCPLDNLYGMHVYSQLELIDARVEFLIEDHVPSVHTAVKLASGKLLQLHILHPAPPSPVENEASTQRDAELLVVAKSVAKRDLPIIVTGDLNDVAWSSTTRLFRKISGLLDPRVGRGMFNTFHADYWFIRWPLDHLFHSHHFDLSFIRRLSHCGSDHFPLLTELVLRSDTRPESQGLDGSAEDERRAQQKIQQQSAAAGQVPDPGQ